MLPLLKSSSAWLLLSKSQSLIYSLSIKSLPELVVSNPSVSSCNADVHILSKAENFVIPSIEKIFWFSPCQRLRVSAASTFAAASS